MAFTDGQKLAISVTERLTSSLSFLGCAFVMLTFTFSKRFRRPVNRIMFYASIGNLIYTIPGFIALDGIAAGPNSGLCQAQAFIIQAMLPADALWNLSMALNVYFTVFKANDMSQLQSREIIYHITNYVLPFGIALALFFISTPDKGHVYGDAAIWCWITPRWEFLRIAVCYGIAWVCMLTAFTIYILAGYRIIQERKGVLNAPNNHLRIPEAELGDFDILAQTTVQTTIGANQITPSNTKTTTPRIPISFSDPALPTELLSKPSQQSQYQVRVSTAASNERRSSNLAVSGAVKKYTKSCMFFFVSLLMTWLPSSINRVWAVANPGTPSPFGLSYAAAFVLPLTGFWNSVVYILMSWSSCQMLWHLDIVPALASFKKGILRTLSCGSSRARPESQFISHRFPDQQPRGSFGTSHSSGSAKSCHV